MFVLKPTKGNKVALSINEGLPKSKHFVRIFSSINDMESGRKKIQMIEGFDGMDAVNRLTPKKLQCN